MKLQMMRIKFHEDYYELFHLAPKKVTIMSWPSAKKEESH